MTEAEAIRKSIENLQKMIGWVWSQNENNHASYKGICTMNRKLGFDWSWDYNPLCKIYGYTKNQCRGCPLAERYGKCADKESENAWFLMHKSKTWKTWLRYSAVSLTQLESLEST